MENNISMFLRPLSHGNHNNLHMEAKFGNSKNPILVVKLVSFFDTNETYISEVRPKNIVKILDHQKIINIIADKLESKFGFELKSIELPKERLSTNTIIQLS